MCWIQLPGRSLSVRPTCSYSSKYISLKCLTGCKSGLKADTLDGFLKLVASLEKLPKQAVKQQQGAYLYQVHTEQSRSLINRVADIMRHLEFRAQHPDNQVMKALSFYQQKEGDISQISKITDLSVDFVAKFCRVVYFYKWLQKC